MAYNARKIVHDVFTSKGIPLLFTWYNDMCVAHDGLGKPSYPSAAAAGVAAAVAAWRRPVEDSNMKEHGALIDLSQPLCDQHSQPLPLHTPSSLPTVDNTAPAEDNENATRTVMMKPLVFVWHSFPLYSELNTVKSHTLLPSTFLSLHIHRLCAIDCLIDRTINSYSYNKWFRMFNAVSSRFSSTSRF